MPLDFDFGDIFAMTRINDFFSTRTLLQIITILSATVAMKLMQGGYFVFAQ